MVTSTINRQKYTSYICSFGYVTTAAWKCPPCKKDAKIDTQKLQNTRENLKVCQLPTKHHNEQFNAVKFQSVSVKKAIFADEALAWTSVKRELIIYTHICSLIELSPGEAERMISG